MSIYVAIDGRHVRTRTRKRDRSYKYARQLARKVKVANYYKSFEVEVEVEEPKTRANGYDVYEGDLDQS